MSGGGITIPKLIYPGIRRGATLPISALAFLNLDTSGVPGEQTMQASVREVMLYAF
jgi:hypothetical protein